MRRSPAAATGTCSDEDMLRPHHKRAHLPASNPRVWRDAETTACGTAPLRVCYTTHGRDRASVVQRNMIGWDAAPWTAGHCPARTFRRASEQRKSNSPTRPRCSAAHPCCCCSSPSPSRRAQDCPTRCAHKYRVTSAGTTRLAAVRRYAIASRASQVRRLILGASAVVTRLVKLWSRTALLLVSYNKSTFTPCPSRILAPLSIERARCQQRCASMRQRALIRAVGLLYRCTAVRIIAVTCTEIVGAAA